ncbi:MAG: hypothetical protein J0I08_12180 [Rhizobiales bacterium]|jgi:hypothetical protein|nr:hypothetical protein [Hyphomicrobiales bacterium]
MTKNRLQNLNDHLFAQIERLCDEDLTPDEIERESRRSIALASVAELTVRIATTQLQAIRMICDHDGRNPANMLKRFVDADSPTVVTGRSLSVVAK